MSDNMKINVAKIFGENVFDDATMQERLPKKVYTKLHQIIAEGGELDIETADVIILVTDVRSGVVATDLDVAQMLLKSSKPIVLCVNKCDTVGDTPLEFYEFYNLGLGDPIAVSSVHGHGTGDLLDAVMEYLPV